MPARGSLYTEIDHPSVLPGGRHGDTDFVPGVVCKRCCGWWSGVRTNQWLGGVELDGELGALVDSEVAVVPVLDDPCGHPNEPLTRSQPSSSHREGMMPQHGVAPGEEMT